MKIIHCADIHLDSKMTSNLPAAKSKQRKAEVLASFCDMCKFADQNGVEVVIIAGDLFDSDRLSPQTKDIVLSQIAECKNTDFLYLCGNHDAGKSLTEYDLPANLKLFGDTWTKYSYGDVEILGAELTAANCRGIYAGLVTNPEAFNVVVMHGAKGYTSGEDLVNLNELSDRNIDYLALGHYHSFETGALGKRGVWCYSGCLEGRGFDECGDKGFVLINIEQGSMTHEFIKTSKRDIFDINCDISGVADSGEILRKINLAVDGIDSSAMVHLTLVGNIPEETSKDITFFNEQLNGRFYFAKVVDDTRVEIHYEDYINDVSLKGEFIRKVLQAGLDLETQSRVIECGLAALKGREVF